MLVVYKVEVHALIGINYIYIYISMLLHNINQFGRMSAYNCNKAVPPKKKKKKHVIKHDDI